MNCANSHRRAFFGQLLAVGSGWHVRPATAAGHGSPQPRQILRVGPGRDVKSLAEAARLAGDGCLVEVDAGDYLADVAYWPQSQLQLRAVRGRVRLRAAGAAVRGKGIFVVAGEQVLIEGFDFHDAQVPDLNGAGVRMDSGSLLIRDCVFAGNETGVLTNNERDSRLELQNCEFGHILRRDGQNHNVYVGQIASLRVQGCYFHHAQIGQLLKSRAARNEVLYNRITDESGGAASYELEFPNGGVAVVLGNLIQQGAQTENAHIISYGVEGYRWPVNELHLVHNTVIDQRLFGGTYLRVSPSRPPLQAPTVQLFNNLFAGNSRMPSRDGWTMRGNHVVDLEEFRRPANHDYRLRPESTLRGRAMPLPETAEPDLTPRRQYTHPRHSVALSGPARDPGALQQG